MSLSAQQGSKVRHIGSRPLARGIARLLAYVIFIPACAPDPGTQASTHSTAEVAIESVKLRRIKTDVEAEGTAFANEATLLASTATARVVRLNFEDGEAVAKGDIIVELTNGEEIASLHEVTARYREAQQRLQRIAVLQESGFGTSAGVDAQTMLRNAAREQMHSAQARVGDRIIRAPFNGVVGLRHLSVGATVAAGAPIAQIVDLSRIKLDFMVSEAVANVIRAGDVISATTPAYPGQLFSGRITSISPTADLSTRSVAVRALLPNEGQKLRPGMLLSVKVPLDVREALSVPETALIREGTRSFVFVVDNMSAVRRREVVQGGHHAGHVEIRRGLHSGERVVVADVGGLVEGDKVKSRSADRSSNKHGG